MAGKQGKEHGSEPEYFPVITPDSTGCLENCPCDQGSPTPVFQSTEVLLTGVRDNSNLRHYRHRWLYHGAHPRPDLFHGPRKCIGRFFIFFPPSNPGPGEYHSCTLLRLPLTTGKQTGETITVITCLPFARHPIPPMLAGKQRYKPHLPHDRFPDILV